jgi:hypothetical protein
MEPKIRKYRTFRPAQTTSIKHGEISACDFIGLLLFEATVHQQRSLTLGEVVMKFKAWLPWPCVSFYTVQTCMPLYYLTEETRKEGVNTFTLNAEGYDAMFKLANEGAFELA